MMFYMTVGGGKNGRETQKHSVIGWRTTTLQGLRRSASAKPKPPTYYAWCGECRTTFGTTLKGAKEFIQAHQQGNHSYLPRISWVEPMGKEGGRARQADATTDHPLPPSKTSKKQKRG